jgi:hypothetical protein
VPTKSSCTAAAWAHTAWYTAAWEANCAAVKADTSSAAAGVTLVVGTIAAALCAFTSVPMPVSWPAAAAMNSGSVVTKVIGVLLAESRLNPRQPCW